MAGEQTTCGSKGYIYVYCSIDRTNYYTIQYVDKSLRGADFWRELAGPEEDRVIRHKSLQDAYRLAVKIPLHFSFQFYGHTVNTVTVATGGFLYMSDFLHSFLTASQYIAPLMANFDTSVGNNVSEVLYRRDDDALIVQWNNVYMKDGKDLGAFTFQVQLYKDDGKIITVYKNIPQPIANLSTEDHPVKVGLSDAYYWDIGQYRTIYPYHTYNIAGDKVTTDSAIIFTHLKTCNMFTNCDDCLHSKLRNFQCYWCSAINSCSDAFDRQRQKWVTSGCVFNITQTDCDHMFSTPTPNFRRSKDKNTAKLRSTTQGNQAWKAVTAAICTIFLLTAAVILGVCVYGYRNPQGTVGQWMVRNRPSELWDKFKQWKDNEKNDGNMTQMG
ncbi:PLXDC2 [Bugula neritina]|uniref:PLXDC2 n=1 Tax=Bugula neritina TaxID=10212 RepID=A0A7J7JQI7_BUGNE|nr:PLXDC2 [Bugula neritina]